MQTVVVAQADGIVLDWLVATSEGRTIKADPMALKDNSFWIWEELTSSPT